MAYNKHLVMIIDDDDDAIAVMKSQISILYDILAANSGKEATNLLMSIERKPDLILLDVNMPGMDGYETLEEIRKYQNLSEIPVVFLTGMTEEHYEYKGLQTDAVDYLKKPVAGRVLIARIHHYIELHSGRKNQDILDMELIDKIAEPLTNRELEVANLMAEFRSDREISELLHVSVPYVKKLVGNVKDKLDLDKRGDIRNYFLK